MLLGPRLGPRVGKVLAKQTSPGLARNARGRQRMTTRRRPIISDSIKVGGTRSAECTPPLGQFDVPDDVAPGNVVPPGYETEPVPYRKPGSCLYSELADLWFARRVSRCPTIFGLARPFLYCVLTLGSTA